MASRGNQHCANSIGTLVKEVTSMPSLLDSFVKIMLICPLSLAVLRQHIMAVALGFLALALALVIVALA